MQNEIVNNNNLLQQKTAIRIIAFWAFSEAFLGGILHGFKVPFAGLVLAFIASLCITLIALADNNKAAILKATLVVIAVKFILSPYTPPMAYLAVLVQGLSGELFFIHRKFIKPATFALTVFSLGYSALQQLLVLTFLFGKSFWNALDIFLNGITKTFIAQQHYSLYIVSFYLACYIVAGIVGGFLNIRIVQQVQQNKLPSNFKNALQQIENAIQNTVVKKEKKTKYKLIISTSILLLVVLAISYTPVVQTNFLKGKVLPIFFRGIIIMLVWGYLLSPLLIKLVEKWVMQYKRTNHSTIEKVMLLLPEIKKIITASWQASSGLHAGKRMQNFITNSLLLAIHDKR